MKMIQKQHQQSLTHKVCLTGLFVILLLWGAADSIFAATAAQYSALPPFLGTDVPPNVMFMLDNSGSMKYRVFKGSFDPLRTDGYFGIFESEKFYKYDSTIPIDPNAYTGIPYNAPVDTSDNSLKGAFVEDSCTPGPINPSDLTKGYKNCWDGKFLNWLVTRRVDAARMVLVGGKTEKRDGFDYDGDGTKEWKLLGNNEPEDYNDTNFTREKYYQSSKYSPVPDNSEMTVRSPANSGAVKTTYDPYSEITIENPIPQPIINDGGDIIGEIGMIRDMDEDDEAGDWLKVYFQETYASEPIVVARPLRANPKKNSDAAVIRIKEITKTYFKIRTEEWEDESGGHPPVDVSYMVVTDGKHTLPGGQKLNADTFDTNDTVANWETEDHNMGTIPVILTTVASYKGSDTVTTRVKDVTATEFSFQLQEEEASHDNGWHTKEKVNVIALEVGQYSVGNLQFDVNLKKKVTHGWKRINWVEPLAGTVHFLAGMQTCDDSDPADLIYKELGMASVSVQIQEEQSADKEIKHKQETVGYVAIAVESLDSYNIALLVDKEPKGLLQDVEDKVRLGISFYNYKKTAFIYRNSKFHGGNMRFELPTNPFINSPNPSDGYRGPINTYVGTDIENIIDAIEHYPQVWGTTPLAENYYEVIRYFQGEDPFYSATVNEYPTDGECKAGTCKNERSWTCSTDSDCNPTNPKSYLTRSGTSNEVWDPYFFVDPNNDGDTTDNTLMPCAQSFILLFTDGAPWTDEYIPCYNSTDDSYNGAISATANKGCTDYDGDKTTNEAASTDAKDNKYRDNLDDIAYWANSVVEQANHTVTGIRDLRPESGMDGEQNLITYTVAFGTNKIPSILQATADHGGGVAYAAEDGRELKNQLTNAFAEMINRSSGTAASVISNTRSGEGALYQSVFFGEKSKRVVDAQGGVIDYTINWAGQVHALLIDAYGNMREDTNDNQQLDVIDDYIVKFNDGGAAASLYKDGDGNQQLQLDTECPSSPCDDQLITLDKSFDELNYLWNSSDWLNTISETAVVDQRTYSSNDKQRYIFTWIDGDGDGVVDDDDGLVDADDSLSELKNFVASADPTSSELIDKNLIFPYLQLYPSFSQVPATIETLSSTDFSQFLKQQSYRQIRYIRGSDCEDSTDEHDCNTLQLKKLSNSKDIDGTAMRSRQFQYDDDLTNIEVWRLGDIIYSTPTLVQRPAEGYHLLYKDKSYASFAAKYEKRRNVIYTGANDGMVHAFNGGFYDASTYKFVKSIPEPYVDANKSGTWDVGEEYDDWDNNGSPNSTMDFDLGAELWAYIPFNLLPHLYWLTEKTYNAGKHVYYVDQKPRIFDARIFAEESECRDSGILKYQQSGCVHPEGWGTVMVLGMRFGGGTIIADMNKQSTSCEDSNQTECSAGETCGDGITACSTSETMCGNGAPCLAQEICSNDSTVACVDENDCVATTCDSGFCSNDATQTCADVTDCSAVTCDTLDYCEDGSVCQIYTCAELGFTDGELCNIHTCADLGLAGTCENRQAPAADDIEMKSAFMIFDITNPELPPKLLAEISMPEMGFSTVYPTVVPLMDDNNNKNYQSAINTSVESGENNWFLAFGSGPADSSGNPGTVYWSTTTLTSGKSFLAGDYDREILETLKSDQDARFYMLDLKKLATDNELYTLDSTGALKNAAVSGLQKYATFDNPAFVSDPITVDFDLDYNADVVYFGTISGTTGDWKGKLRRIVMENDSDPTQWPGINTLIDVQQPITAAPSVGMDDDGRNWVYFGTGRYFTVTDKKDSSLQSYYGIKEPLFSCEAPDSTKPDDKYCSNDNSPCTKISDCDKSWLQVSSPEQAPATPPDSARPNGPNKPDLGFTDSLVNVTNYQVFTDKDVLMFDSSNSSDFADWKELEEQQEKYSGWYLDFDDDRSNPAIVDLRGERNLGQAALLGGLLSFTTFIPNTDICVVGGRSDLWALYYKTGTAYFSAVLGTHDGFNSYKSRDDRAKRSYGDQELERDDTLISGLATSPSIHTGRETGSVILVQSSTGEIIKIEEENPLSTKSGMQSWKQK